MPTPNINEIVGQNVASIRESAGLSLDAVARAAHPFGLRWNSARISRIERGDGNVTLDTLLMLCALLSDMTMKDISVASLVRSTGPVAIAPEGTLSPGVAEKLVRDGQVSYRQTFEEGGDIIAATVASVHQANDQYFKILDPEFRGDLVAVRAHNEGRTKWSLSDERNARKLGLTDAEFLGWCVVLWGRLMSLEVEDRAPEGATPQKKGRITRELLAELREALEQHRASDE